MRKISQWLVVLGLTLSLFSCATQQARLMKSFDKAGEEAYVRLERTEGFGTCPVYEVTIKGDRTLVYTGKAFAKPKGKLTATISEDDWKALQLAIAESAFFSLEDEYDGPISDVPSAITEVRISDKKHKTITNRWEAPEKLLKLETFIDKLWQKYLLEE